VNWQAVRQKVVEWGIVFILGACAQHYAEFQALKMNCALDHEYIRQLWEDSRKK